MKKNSTTLAHQRTMIICLLALALLLAVLSIVLPRVFKEEEQTVYLVNEYGDYVSYVVKDSLGNTIGDLAEQADGTTKNKYNVKRGDGEKVAFTFNLDGAKISYRPYLYKEIALDDVSKVTVTNSYGKMTVYNYDGNFFIEGAEKNLYNSKELSELVLQARYMLAIQYVENPLDDEQYGLCEDNCKAIVEVEDKDGNCHKVIIGNEVLSSGGYYIKNTQKKDLVYITDTGVGAFLNSTEYYLSPAIVNPIEEQQRNYIQKLAIVKNSTPFFACEMLSDDERVGVYSNQLHRMTYPEQTHVLNTRTLYDMFYEVGGLSGSAVEEYAVSEKENSEELLALYGLDNPTESITFTCQDKQYDISVGDAFDLQGSVYYHVYSSYQDTIVAVPASSMTFLQYELYDLYSENVFQYNIKEVSQIEVKYDGKHYVYNLEHDGSELYVNESVTSKTIDTPSFRQFYISLMNVTLGGYSSFEGADTNELLHSLTYTVTLSSGEKLNYEFYSESTMSCYMIVDGKGGFKTDRKWIDTIIKNSDMLINGEEIKSQF